MGGLYIALFTMSVKAKTKVTSQPFGKLPDGPPIGIYTLSDGACEARIATYGGKPYELQAGLCLETQHFPDSPNHPDFPTVELKPGQRYHTVTIYSFSAR